MVRAKSRNMITKEMNINEVISKYPESVDVFMNYGLHCIGCALAGGETIEQGAFAHGFDNKTITNMIKEVNEYVKNIKFDEGNIINITSRAAKHVKDLIKKSKGAKYLRIAIIEMPFGQNYGFKFEKTKKKNDILIEKEKVGFLLSKKDSEKIKGATMDYLSFIPGNGFKIYNRR